MRFAPAPILACPLLLPLSCGTAPQETGSPPAARPAPSSASPAEGWRAGAASADITPEGPIRLSGYGGRRAESEGVVQRLHARALALRWGEEAPALLVAVENAAVPAAIAERLAWTFSERGGVPRERCAIVSTHTHTGPMLSGAIPNLFGEDVPPEHQERIDRYTEGFQSQVERAGLTALERLSPARLALARGSASFAANRRTAGGPVDHELSLLSVRGADGALRALVFNYACHCTTLGGEFNQVCGDWAGYASEMLEASHSGAVALGAIGCGADSDPAPRTGLDFARRHGAALAAEVERLLAAEGGWSGVAGPLEARFEVLSHPFDRPPTAEEWKAREAQGGAVAYHARKNLSRLARGETLPGALPHPVQTWCFSDDLAAVFLGGEVVVDYVLRLKSELDASRLWVSAYANDVACYIPSERILREGGYEGADAMVYYDQPMRLASGVEDRIVTAVRAGVHPTFRQRLGVEIARAEGVAPSTPEEALAALRAADGLRLELAACEPLVASPVAIDFGPDGRLWVVEMLDYPCGMDGAGAPGGRVRVLEDLDGDRRFDRATTFLEGLPFPTGVLAWRGGALVCAAPDVLYAQDRDGDGRADSVAKLLSGFATDNEQARVNGLALGLDNWVYGSCGLFGGAIRSSAGGPEVLLRGRDFRFRPETGALEPASGCTQQGRARGDFDDWFGCESGALLRHYPLHDHDLRRNLAVSAPPQAVDVPAGEDPSRLFPISRTLARFNDLQHAGRATSACGLALYRDRILGESFAGNAFTCEPVHNLVHREVLAERGATFAGRRAGEERAREFLASSDNWFRPVQARTGPDGALWIVDMARFVIEHPRWIPADRLQRLDVRAGAHLGRIWRVVPGGGDLRRPARIDLLEGAELAAALDTPNGTQRDLAQQHLAWRGGPQAVAPLRALARSADRAEVRAQALAVLEGLGAIDAATVGAALGDPLPGVLRQAARLAGATFASVEGIGERLAALAGDGDPKVAIEVAAALAAWRDPRAADALARLIVERAADAHVRAAALAAAAAHVEAVVERCLAAARERPDLDLPLRELVATAVRERSEAAAARLAAYLGELDAGGRTEDALALFSALLEAAARSAGLKLPPDSAALLERARAIALDPAREVALRATAAALLLRAPSRLEEDLQAARELLGGGAPSAVQHALIQGLARLEDARASELLLESWDAFLPEARGLALDALLSRPHSCLALLGRAAEQRDLLAALDAARRQVLATHPDPAVRARAEQVLGSVRADRAAALARYAHVEGMRGDPARGLSVFERACSACHAAEGVGRGLGPDLAALKDRSAPALLASILDPNRAIQPDFVAYRAVSAGGGSHVGLLEEESAGAVVLRTLAGERLEIARDEILELSSTRLSLMPEGLENDVSPQAMADLIAWLQELGQEPRRFAGNAPELVRPAADGSLALLATNCRIHGDSLVFEQPFRNLGYWHSESDRAVWDVELDVEGEFEVHLEWACDQRVAGNTYVLEGVGGPLRGTVASTGTWNRYRREPIGRVRLPSGRSRLAFRSDGAVRGALIDLRALWLVPPGATPADEGPAGGRAPPPAELSRAMLDPGSTDDEREQAFARALERPAETIAALAEGTLSPEEEYRRIPWIWRVAISAARRDEPAGLRAMIAAALPQEEAPLRHWQAVALGGGLVQGVAQAGRIPGERLREALQGDADLLARLESALEGARALAHDAAVPDGTRYDALRVLGLGTWERFGADAARYLDAVPEIQMGAVGALLDFHCDGATARLLEALPRLSPDNRSFALDGLVRDAARASRLLDAIVSGAVERSALSELHVRALREHADPAIRVLAGAGLR